MKHNSSKRFLNLQHDTAIQKWLDFVAKESQGEGRFPSVSVYGDTIYLYVVHIGIAQRAVASFPKNGNYALKIFVGRKLYYSSLQSTHHEGKTMIIHQANEVAMFENWGLKPQNRRFWKMIESEQRTNTIGIYSADPQTGFRCEALAPLLGLGNGANKVLAINAQDKIGKPILLSRADVPSAEVDALERARFIAEHQLGLIEQVRTSGEIASTSYSMEWAPPGKPLRTWTKQLIAAPLFNENDEVTEVAIRTISDASSVAYWQAVADYGLH